MKNWPANEQPGNIKKKKIQPVRLPVYSVASSGPCRVSEVIAVKNRLDCQTNAQIS